jgi:acyl dehydratase
MLRGLGSHRSVSGPRLGEVLARSDSRVRATIRSAIVARAAEGSAPVVASGLHVAAAAMRRLVETRSALRAAMAQRGEALPELGVSPGFSEMGWPDPVHDGDVVRYSMETLSKHDTSKAKWGLIGNRFRGVNQRGEEVLVFSSVVLVARRGAER